MTTAEKGKKNGWWLARAAALEGACRLAGLCCRLGGLYLAYARMTGYLAVGWTDSLPGGAVWWLLPPAVLQGLLLSPLRLYRQAFYAGLPGNPFAAGWRRWGAAVGWRWQLWWRRTAALMAALAPAAAVWSLGDHLGRSGRGETLPWLLLGAAAGLLGAVAVAVWQCRYAVAPLLVLQGCPAGAAMGFSAQAMRRHIGEYLNLLGSWALPLASCLLVVPAVWVLPRFGAARTAWLCARQPQTAVAGLHPDKAAGSAG